MFSPDLWKLAGNEDPSVTDQEIVEAEEAAGKQLSDKALAEIIKADSGDKLKAEVEGADEFDPETDADKDALEKEADTRGKPNLHRAVIIRELPELMDKVENAEKFYSDIKQVLNMKGYQATFINPDMSKQVPLTDVVIAHGGGAKQLIPMIHDTRVLALGMQVPLGIISKKIDAAFSNPADSLGRVKSLPTARSQVSDAHFILTPQMRTQLIDFLDNKEEEEKKQASFGARQQRHGYYMRNKAQIQARNRSYRLTHVSQIRRRQKRYRGQISRGSRKPSKRVGSAGSGYTYVGGFGGRGG